MSASQRNVVVAAAAATAIAGVGISWYLLSSSNGPSASPLTELHRLLTMSAEDRALSQRLDRFEFAQRLLRDDVIKLETLLNPFFESSSSALLDAPEHAKQFLTMKKQLQEFSADIDHIFASLDHMAIGQQSEVRARRKLLIDWFADEAKKVDALLLHIEQLEKQHDEKN